jgi:hypothetical protein
MLPNFSHRIREPFQLKCHNFRHILGEIAAFPSIILLLTLFTIIFVMPGELISFEKVSKTLRKGIGFLTFLKLNKESTIFKS